MTRKQYIAFGIFTAALAALIYIMPPVTEWSPLAGAILGVILLAIMTICVFRGGLTDVSGE